MQSEWQNSWLFGERCVNYIFPRFFVFRLQKKIAGRAAGWEKFSGSTVNHRMELMAIGM